MKITPIPALDFFEFNSSYELANATLDDIKNSDLIWDHENKLAYKKNNVYYYEPLFDWFQDCLDKIDDHLLPKDDEKFKLSICDCWINRQKLGESTYLHVHSMSVMSGVYYLHDSATKTKFFIPNLNINDGSSIFGNIKNTLKLYEVTPEKGKLIIFPSHIKHSVDIHRNMSTRYTIAFNLFYSGIMSVNYSSQLEIKVKDVKSKYLGDL